MKIVLIIVGVLVLYCVITTILFKRKLNNYDPKNHHKDIKDLSDENFDKIIENGVTLVDFWAEWCMPCKMQGPIVDEVAKEIGDKAQICKVDVEHNKITPEKYKIQNIPSIIIFKDGVEVKRFVGMKSKNVLVKEIQNNLV